MNTDLTSLPLALYRVKKKWRNCSLTLYCIRLYKFKKPFCAGYRQLLP